MLSAQRRSWILAGVALLVGTLELALDNGLVALSEAGPVAGVVEVLEIVIMVPGLAVGVFFASEWLASHKRTMQRRLRDAREERFALLGRLAASVAHEIRNPLQSMRLVHEALEERCDGRDADLLARMDANLTDLDGAITRIYELVRPGFADEARSEEVDCRALLAELAAEETRDHPQVAVRWRPVDLRPETIHGVRSALRIVFANLLRNAVEAACEQDGEAWIAVHLRRQDDRLEVVVRNRGTLPESFDGNGGALPTTKRQGLGLGVMISEQVLARVGGELDFRQEGDEVIARVLLRDGSGLEEGSE